MNDEQLIEKFTLLNAVKYKGKANLKSTLGSVIKANPDFKSRIPEIRDSIEITIERINAMTYDQQRARLLELDPESLKEEKKRRKEIKIDLPNLNRFEEVVLRLAPFPSGPLHIGNSRMVILNDYCAKKYNGKLYLVFDDTIGSETKIIDPTAYDSIPEGLDFLGVKTHKTYFKSDRIETFYKYSLDILTNGKAYVCTCKAKTWREQYKITETECPCRTLPIETNLERWEKMLDGTYPEKGAVVRLKSGMDTPDPAIRDPIMLRISEREHPRVGSKYRVWPLLEFSWGIDDHDFGISHIIRGKDLRKEGIVEELLWDIYGWEKPTIILYGRMKIKGLKLSKSKMAQLIKDNIYQDWTDPRTWSLQALRRRGIQSDAIRKSLLAFGISSVDVIFSPENIYSANRPLIDHSSNRYFAVTDSVKTEITSVPKDILIAQPLNHPEFPERGRRTIQLQKENDTIHLQLPRKDLENIKIESIFRLKDLMNVTLELLTQNSGKASFHSTEVDVARKANARMVQWVPPHLATPIRILMPDGMWIEGLAEQELLKTEPGQIIQFERFAFCRVEEVGSIVTLVWVHQ